MQPQQGFGGVVLQFAAHQRAQGVLIGAQRVVGNDQAHRHARLHRPADQRVYVLAAMPPSRVWNLKPLMRGGRWLAVIITAPSGVRVQGGGKYGRGGGKAAVEHVAVRGGKAVDHGRLQAGAGSARIAAHGDLQPVGRGVVAFGQPDGKGVAELLGKFIAQKGFVAADGTAAFQPWPCAGIGSHNCLLWSKWMVAAGRHFRGNAPRGVAYWKSSSSGGQART